MPATALSTPAADPKPSAWVPLAVAAEKLGIPLRTLQMRCARHWHPKGLAELRAVSGRKPSWYLHVSLDPRIDPCQDAKVRDAADEQSLLERFPEHHVRRAAKKAHWLRTWRTRCTREEPSAYVGPRRTDRQIAVEIVAEAKRVEGHDFKISVRTLQLWHEQYNETADDGRIRGLEGLVDRYAVGSPAESSRSAAALNYFFDLYRAPSRPSLSLCHAMTVRHAQADGLLWPASCAATRAWLDKYDDIPLTFLFRHGKTAYSKKYMPYAEQDWSLVDPGSFYVSDHTQCDFWVAYKRELIRPWFTAVQDCRSRRILGWRLGPAPHQEAILLALRMAFHQAVPEVLRIDNGKDFASKAIVGLTKQQIQALKNEGVDWREDLLDCDDVRWKGIAAELGIKLIFAKKYSAWSKATLERFFGTFEGQCGKTFATYTGNAPENRPECLPDIVKGSVLAEDGRFKLRDGSCVPTLEEARDRLGDWLDLYDRTPHEGSGIEGATPLAVWNAGTGKRVAGESSLDFLMSVRGAYKVGPNGVSLTVGNKRLSFGARSVALRSHVGREVLVAVDPQWPTRCVAFEPGNRRFIAALEPNQKINPLLDIDGLREVNTTLNRERKAMTRSRAAGARANLSFSQRASQYVRETAAALRATGTDDVRAQGASPVTIRPVRTGFEGQSIPVQTHLAGASFSEPAGDLSDLLSGVAQEPEPDDLSLDDLLSTPVCEEAVDNALDF